MPVSQGQALGHYEVLSPLGAGGMGEVYRALDRKLGREVAVKVLPDAVAGDASALEHFKREARAVSALQHPGICAVYDVDEHDGRPFIVMELLEGETLRQRLTSGPVPLELLLDFAIQLAEALDAAHAKGIVHRDVKPSNVVVTARGHVKLIDFGLAKLTQAAAASSRLSTAAADDTSPGTVRGTVPYMSPEQVRGQPLDARSDLFSLGAVLYEMATGCPAFAGATSGIVFDGILNRQPTPLAEATPALPADLARIVSKALEKERELRYQTAAEIRGDLKRLRRDSSGATRGGVSRPGRVSVRTVSVSLPISGKRLGIAAAVLVVVAACAAGALWLREPAPPRVVSSRTVTSDRTVKGFPIAVDGSRVYYVAEVGWGSDIVQAPLAGGESVRLESSVRIPRIHHILPSRGELLVEEQVRRGTNFFWRVSTVSGRGQRIGDLIARHAAWTPEGERILFTRGNELWIAEWDGSAGRKLLNAPALVFEPRLSPDARRVRYTVQDPKLVALWEAAADGSGARRVLPEWGDRWSHSGCWTPDGRYYVFEANLANGARAVYALRESGRWPRSRPEPVRLTPGPLNYWAATLTPDGRTLVALGAPENGGAEIVRYDAASGSFVPFLRELPPGQVEFSPRGDWVAWTSWPDATLWRARPDGSEKLQLTFSPARVLIPRWSPDGRRIAFSTASTRPLKWKLAVVGVEGGAQKLLRATDGQDVDVNWSPDGRRLVFSSVSGPSASGETASSLKMLDLGSGAVSDIAGSEGLFSVRWSADGRRIVALSLDELRLSVYEFATGRWRELLSGTDRLGYPTFTPDGQNVQLWRGRSIARVRLADGAVEPIVQRLDRIGLASIWPADKWLGMAPDGSPLALRALNTPEVYAFEMEWP